jgi:Cdc6-like AAA superfamily ATPase
MNDALADSRIAVTVIGIANSVELFRGELNQVEASVKVSSDILQKSAFITKNEQKLLFKPYTAEDLAKIVFNLYREHLRDFVNQKRRFNTDKSKMSAAEEFRQLEAYQIVHPKSFALAAGKIDKLSGDIRVCFEILRETVQRKLDLLRSSTDTSC